MVLVGSPSLGFLANLTSVNGRLCCWRSHISGTCLQPLDHPHTGTLWPLTLPGDESGKSHQTLFFCVVSALELKGHVSDQEKISKHGDVWGHLSIRESPEFHISTFSYLDDSLVPKDTQWPQQQRGGGGRFLRIWSLVILFSPSTFLTYLT